MLVGESVLALPLCNKNTPIRTEVSSHIPKPQTQHNLLPKKGVKLFNYFVDISLEAVIASGKTATA